MNKFFDKFYIILLPLLTLGIFSGISLFPICLFLIAVRLFSTNKETAGFYLLLFGGTIAGLTRTYYPQIPIYGIFFDLLGLILLFKDYKNCISEQHFGFVSLCTILLVFLFFYLIGDHTEYANNKIIQIIIRGLILFCAYYVFIRSRKIDIECLTQLLLINTIALIAFSITYYSFNVGDFFNYDWYRKSSEQWAYQNQAGILSGYQKVGIYAAFAAGLYSAFKKANVFKLIYYNIIATQLILISGCRQALLALILIIILRIIYFTNTKDHIKKVFALLICCFALYYIFDLIQNKDVSSILTKTLESGDTGRFMIYAGAWKLYLNNILFGVGLGGFPLYVNIPLAAPWPHNIILEILCECGSIGFIFITFIIINFIIRSKISIRYITASGCYLFLFLIVLLVRTMVSGDLTGSIELFSVLFSCPDLSKYVASNKVKMHKSLKD